MKNCGRRLDAITMLMNSRQLAKSVFRYTTETSMPGAYETDEKSISCPGAERPSAIGTHRRLNFNGKLVKNKNHNSIRSESFDPRRAYVLLTLEESCPLQRF
jgi:hypothetical protein